MAQKIYSFLYNLNPKFSLVGSVVGQALSEHPDVRKLGFTGSTPIGKTIMER